MPLAVFTTEGQFTPPGFGKLWKVPYAGALIPLPIISVLPVVDAPELAVCAVEDAKDHV